MTVAVENRTPRQRIYTLNDGSTLRVNGYSKSRTFDESLISPHLKRDDAVGTVQVTKVNVSPVKKSKDEKEVKK